MYSYGFSCNASVKNIAVDANVQKRERASINISLQDSEKNGSDLITGVYNFSSGDFYNNFVVPLSNGIAIQQENSTLSLSDVAYTSNGEDKTNAKASLNETYSYPLDKNKIANRAIIKSTKT